MGNSKRSRCHKRHELFAAGRRLEAGFAVRGEASADPNRKEQRSDPPGRPLTLGTRVTHWSRVVVDGAYDWQLWHGEVQAVDRDPLSGTVTNATVLFHDAGIGDVVWKTLPIGQLKIDPEHK